MRLRPVLLTLAAGLLGLASLCAYSLAQTPVRGAVQPVTDRIIIDKGAHRMTLLRKGRAIRTYRVALGRGGLGNKEAAGDNKVPEGVYRIAGRNPDSAYHLSLRIGYPTPPQVRAAGSRGVDPGGDIMIHGLRNGLGWIGVRHRLLDRTQGCIAVTNDEIEEIWRIVPDRTVVEIRA